MKDAPRNPCPPTCPKRSPTCHGTCKDYLEYWRFNREQDGIRYREAQLDQMKITGCQRAKKYARLMKGRLT